MNKFIIFFSSLIALILLNMTHVIGENLEYSNELEIQEVSTNEKKHSQITDVEDLVHKEFQTSVGDNETKTDLEHLAANNLSQEETRETTSPFSINTNINSPTNTWTPRFVWLGDIQNNDELKCFAAFLIGSLSDQNNVQMQNPQNPGIILTHSENTETSSSLQSGAPIGSETYIRAPQKNNARDLTQQISNQPLAKNATNLSSSPSASSATQFVEAHVGVAFLEFRHVTGSLSPIPFNLFSAAAVNSTSGLNLKGKIQYNRTPVYELNFGNALNHAFSFSMTLQSQEGLRIRTTPIHSIGGTNNPVTYVYESDLALYALGGKLCLQWANINKGTKWDCSLYIAGGISAGWQSWTSQKLYISVIAANSTYSSETIPFKANYFPKLCYHGDAGLSFKPIISCKKLSFKMGCKFMDWGSTRGLGNIKNQDGAKVGIFKPIRIKSITSWVPYLGIQLNF